MGETVLKGPELALRRRAIQDEIDRLELMVEAEVHGFVKAHLREQLDGYRAELDAIEDLVLADGHG